MRIRLLVSSLIAVTLALSGCAVVVEDVGAPLVQAPAPERVPGSTLAASAVTADVPDGLSLAVVVSPAPGEQESIAVEAVRASAAEHSGTVTVFDRAAVPESVSLALAADADVIVGIGPSAVGAIDLASASNLETSFLVLGTQLAEPTGNVIAVVWPGAQDRAVFADVEAEFVGADTYAATALETGLAAFASDLDGHVIELG